MRPGVDGRDKPGHDERAGVTAANATPMAPPTPALTLRFSNVLVPFMSAQAIPAEACNDPGPHGPGPHGPGPHDADAQGHRRVLNDLIAMGADLARFLHGQAAAHAAQQAAAPPAQPATHAQQITDVRHATDAQPIPASDALISLAAAFDRTARAVRRGILLARSLAEPVQPARDPAQARAATRRRILREVEDAIQRTGANAGARDGQDGAETLQAELRDRLDAPDLDWDITARPVADIIAEICRDLGLAMPSGLHPWKRRTPDDIARLCAAAAAPSRARQPGAGSLLKRGVAHPTPGPHPDEPAAMSLAQPSPIQAGPIQAGGHPPEDPAGTVAMLLRHPAPVHGRCRPPPA